MKALIALLILVSMATAYTPTNWQQFQFRKTAMTAPFGFTLDNFHGLSTGEALSATGGMVLLAGTSTALFALPWLPEPQRKQWYKPLAYALAGGFTLWAAGMAVGWEK